MTKEQELVKEIMKLSDEELLEELTRPLSINELNRMVEREALRRLLLNRQDKDIPNVLSLNLKLSIDGDQYCVLMGENLQEGIAGFGETVTRALHDFADGWEEEYKKFNMPR